MDVFGGRFQKKKQKLTTKKKHQTVKHDNVTKCRVFPDVLSGS